LSGARPPATRFAELEGAAAFCEWFGSPAPCFHDASVAGLSFEHRGRSRIVLHAFRMTSEVDPGGYFVLDRHCEVSFTLDGVTEVRFRDFDEGSILQGLTVTIEGGKIVLDLESVVGADGRVSAAGCQVAFAPRQPQN
jgi:hypothetical protein